MDEFGNNILLSDWVIEKYVVRKENDKFRLRIGINSIGRHSSSDLRIDSPLVSRHHAEILVPESGRSSIELRDLNSINGTYICNDLYRATTKKLKENMIIGFGAEYDDEDIEQIPIYILKYDPINRARICGSPIAEFIISDEEEDHIDMKPIIPTQPPQNVTVNILKIFGDADDAILDGLQRINPLVCEAVKKTTNAETVFLSSDDEEIIEKEQPKGADENCNSSDANKSPDIVIPNINDNNDIMNSDDESENGSLEENQLIYSQALINEMKSEMVDGVDDELENTSADDAGSLGSKQGAMSPQIISLVDTDEDEDIFAKNDDFDEDLERKVSNWKNLLFSSQVFPKMNSSQTLISDASFANDSSNDEQDNNNQNKESNAMSENSMIENLFEPLWHKLDDREKESRDIREKRESREKRGRRESTEKREEREKREKGEKRATIEKSNEVHQETSPVIKSKKRKVMRIIDESDEESDQFDQPDQIDSIQTEKNSADRTEETRVHKSNEVTEVAAKTKPATAPIPKPIHRGPPIIVTPPRLKFGRRESIVVSLKSNRSGFLEKKRTKKSDPKLKEMRKERLKEIVHKTDENVEIERYINDMSNPQCKTKTKTKVKNTVHNRGAFLCEMDEIASTSSVKTHSKPTKVINPPPPNFLKQDSSTSNNWLNEVKKVIRKNAERARERSAPKKLRFADVEKSFDEHEKIEMKTKEIISKMSPNATTTANEATKSTAPTAEPEELDIIIPMPDTDLVDNQEKPKKTVRFKDEPTIYYFESDCVFARKVDRKDLSPRLSYRNRRNLMRRTFPNVDRTDDIISLILSYSNEWLSKKSAIGAAECALKEEPTPIPPIFESFDHYKRVFFPLMKLEYMSSLEREMQINGTAKPLTSELQDIVVNKERVLLVTKCANNDWNQMQTKKCDLVLLEIGESKINVFAYLVTRRNFGIPADRFNMNIYVEVMSNSINDNYLRNSKSIIIRPAMDNLQVTIGAYNAIYQLENTPLSELLLNPTLLMGPSSVMTTELDDEIAPEVISNNPNDEQLNGIRHIYKKICFNKAETTPNISLVQGPPGTGKSVLVVNLALQTIYGLGRKFHDKKILICAQSNCAIDAVTAKLLEARGRIKEKKYRYTLARFGIFEKMNPKVHPVSLHNVLEFERVKKLSQNLYPQLMTVPIWKSHLRKLEDDLRGLRLQAKTNVDILQRVETKKRELDTLHNAYKNILSTEEEQSVYKNYLWQSNIICTTLSSCVKLYNWIDYFDVCIIDEATQCTEPWTLLPLKFRINSLVLVGDSQQLPATVLSKQAADYGLSRSLLTRIESSITNGAHSSNLKESNVMFSLRVQYRMHPEICKFPNSFFYKNTLINAENTFNNTTPLMPYSIFNLTYSQNKSSGQGKITNQLEAGFVVELLKALNEYISFDKHSYGVITPYAHQRKILADAVYSARLPHVTVNTIDSYQGIEKDVIIISNARTNGVGFLANPQRLNVAITRPKMCLILCGNFRNLHSVPAWRCLLKDAQQRHIYYEIDALDIRDVKSKVIQRILAKK